MGMPVMNIRHVVVLMLQGLVNMPMGVFFMTIFPVLVVMMAVIVAMPVFMLKLFMAVQMHVIFP